MNVSEFILIRPPSKNTYSFILKFLKLFSTKMRQYKNQPTQTDFTIFPKEEKFAIYWFEYDRNVSYFWNFNSSLYYGIFAGLYVFIYFISRCIFKRFSLTLWNWISILYLQQEKPIGKWKYINLTVKYTWTARLRFLKTFSFNINVRKKKEFCWKVVKLVMLSVHYCNVAAILDLHKRLTYLWLKIRTE